MYSSHLCDFLKFWSVCKSFCSWLKIQTFFSSLIEFWLHLTFFFSTNRNNRYAEICISISRILIGKLGGFVVNKYNNNVQHVPPIEIRIERWLFLSQFWLLNRKRHFKETAGKVAIIGLNVKLNHHQQI